MKKTDLIRFLSSDVVRTSTAIPDDVKHSVIEVICKELKNDTRIDVEDCDHGIYLNSQQFIELFGMTLLLDLIEVMTKVGFRFTEDIICTNRYFGFILGMR